jgi:hypothetical protein
VTVATGDDPGAGTNAHVYVALIGDETSPGMELDAKGNDFERGSVADYDLKMTKDYGEITNVRISLRSDAKTPWQLASIKVTNKTTDTYYGKNECNCWLDSRDTPIDLKLTK